MSDNMRRVLGATNKLYDNTYGTNGVLARLLRIVFGDLGIGIQIWNNLMLDYIRDPLNGIPANRKDQTSARGNIVKEIFRPQITWKVFCKGLRILQVTRLEITITLHRRNCTTPTVHTTAVDLNLENPQEFDLDDEDDEDIDKD